MFRRHIGRSIIYCLCDNIIHIFQKGYPEFVIGSLFHLYLYSAVMLSDFFFVDRIIVYKNEDGYVRAHGGFPEFSGYSGVYRV